MQVHSESRNEPPRAISRVLNGLPATDGAGVELTRMIGSPELGMLDPFLLLDAIRSDQPQDYLAGFPSHPHRGFETVTYLLAGRMRHRDSAGHEGVIEAGGVQWMTAGRGIVHSEMPEQENGLLDGFQLWVNLPASHKLAPPAYQEFTADAVPVERRERGVEVRVVAGSTSHGTVGPVRQPLTDPRYLDVTVPAGGWFAESLPAAYNAFLYVIRGSLTADAAAGGQRQVTAGQLAVLTRGGELALNAGDHGVRLLLVAGRPLNEPVARGGPFVMNTRAQILEAYDDYAAGRLG
jgi:redox-sensitive bicupin YhaK (pirin superfamily)